MKLTIKNLQYGDFGNYRCISKNSLGETEGSIRVYGKYSYTLNSIHIYFTYSINMQRKAALGFACANVCQPTESEVDDAYIYLLSSCILSNVML